MLTQNYSDCAAKPWTAPPEAKDLPSPLTASPKVIAEGKANYGIFCEGCHGPRGQMEPGRLRSSSVFRWPI
jgi:cytochrome c5